MLTRESWKDVMAEAVIECDKKGLIKASEARSLILSIRSPLTVNWNLSFGDLVSYYELTKAFNKLRNKNENNKPL